MPNKQKKSATIKLAFLLFGLGSLFFIIRGYGLDVMRSEIERSGILLVLLAFTFIPTLICYALSWMFATNHEQMTGTMTIFKKTFVFIKYTTISISWNNMTPFLKIGGEPLKYMMLLEHLSKKEALASTINYNIIHLLATGLSFLLASFILILFYNLHTSLLYSLLLFSFLSLLLFSFVFFSIAKKSGYISKNYSFRVLRFLSINLNLSLRRLRKLYASKPFAFMISLLLDVAGRFVEGITFYFGFQLIKLSISLPNSALLDVGRTFIDTVFFFVPFQVGTREEGVRFFMKNVLNIETQGFLTAVFLYRFVEIFWVIVGYILWVSGINSSREAKV